MTDALPLARQHSFNVEHCFPVATGSMSQKVRQFDWSNTSLGAIEAWPAALRVACEMILASHFPKCLVWGEGLVTIYNDAFRPILGNKPEALGRPFSAVWEEAWASLDPVVRRAFNGESTYIEDFHLEVNRYGWMESAYFTFCYSPVRDEHGRVVGMVDTVIETTAKVAAQTKARHLTDSLAAQVAEATAERDQMWRLATEAMAVIDTEGRFIACNPVWTQMLGWESEQIIGRLFIELVETEDKDAVAYQLAQLTSSGARCEFECRIRCRDGSHRAMAWSTACAENRIHAVGRDITAAREANAALKKTEAALYQAQKMESVGQLTGGVAHDFNNLLQVVSSNLQLLARMYSENPRAEKHVVSALAAVNKGAKLTSQLLAFARRQPLAPKVVNVGRFINGMDDLLRRTLGEAIEVETIVSGGLWNSLVDPSQVENALLNLAINARDAMNGVGKLTIEAGNASLDDAYCRAHSEVTSGQYVVLAVTDTGSGMPPEVLAKVFDPFFTTKPEGKGTGLGLSMVYGFVKQSGGHVKVYSELGHGTTVKIYLPRVAQAEEVVAAPVSVHELAGGQETILVAEDDSDVRSTTAELLETLGYRVLQAKDAASALAIVESGMKIDLLFTDVVMPGSMRTPELARKAKAFLPGLVVLFTSGYTQNAIVHGGRLDPGVELIGKPYTHESIATKLRQLLDKRPQPAKVS